MFVRCSNSSSDILAAAHKNTRRQYTQIATPSQHCVTANNTSRKNLLVYSESIYTANFILLGILNIKDYNCTCLFSIITHCVNSMGK